MILVIDWNRFIDEINLDYLSDADFCYRIWSYDRDGNDRIILAESQDDMPDNILTVECTVPITHGILTLYPQKDGFHILTGLCVLSLLCILIIIAKYGIYRYSAKTQERQYEARS